MKRQRLPHAVVVHAPLRYDSCVKIHAWRVPPYYKTSCSSYYPRDY